MKHNQLTLPIPTNAQFRGEWIIVRLHIAGSGAWKIAEEEGVSRPAVTRAIRRMTSLHLERAVAAKLGLTAEQLFPDRFDPETGKRLARCTRPPNRTTKRGETARLKEVAA